MKQPKRIIALVTLLWAVMWSISYAQERVAAPPQLVYMTRKGLDTEYNPIDRSVNIFGFICEKNYLNPRPCRIETELTSFLRELPPSFDEATRELSGLGVRCAQEESQIFCSYDRVVEQSIWKAGGSDPVSTTNEFFRITFLISKNVSGRDYRVSFHRETKPK